MHSGAQQQIFELKENKQAKKPRADKRDVLDKERSRNRLQWPGRPQQAWWAPSTDHRKARMPVERTMCPPTPGSCSSANLTDVKKIPGTDAQTRDRVGRMTKAVDETEKLPGWGRNDED